MTLFLDSFWRSLTYCLHPRIIGLSFLPLLLLAGVSSLVFWLGWEPMVAAAQVWLKESAAWSGLFGWIEGVAQDQVRGLLAPLLVLVLVVPLVTVTCLLVVAWSVTPAVVALVHERRFPELREQGEGSFWGGLGVNLVAVVLALLALLLSLPLWLVPPLALVLPPLIWGWLTARVMVYDVLARHATRQERRELSLRHRVGLLTIGVLTGYMGAAPAAIWAMGAMSLVLVPLLVALSVWVYTFVFVFASLWFTHYVLAALARMRLTQPPVLSDPVVAEEAQSTLAPPADPSSSHV